jgi:uncharacterized membrane protein YhaH (DUF805 family)
MKPGRILYWIVTGALAVLMLMASVPDVLQVPQALEIFAHLGYPVYLLPFLGVAKILGVIGIVAPRLRTVKEWAYAGLTFDLLGALLLGSSYMLQRPTSRWTMQSIQEETRSYARSVQW